MEGGGLERPLAPRELRFWAYVFDVGIILPFTFLGRFALRTVQAHQPGSAAVVLVVCGIGGAALGGWQLYLETKGQTLGKRLQRLRVVGPDGGQPGFVRGVLVRRCAVPVIGVLVSFVLGPVIALLCVLADPLFVFGATQRCLHDRLAGTRVIVDA